MTWSGLTIVMLASAWMSAAVMDPAFEARIARVMDSRLWETMSTFLRFRTISVTSSTTPSMLWNSLVHTVDLERGDGRAFDGAEQQHAGARLPMVWP